MINTMPAMSRPCERASRCVASCHLATSSGVRWIHMRVYAERSELRHAGPNDVNREAELKPPSRVACSDLLNEAAPRRGKRMS